MTGADGAHLADRDAVRNQISRAQHRSARVVSKVDRALVLWTSKRPFGRFGNLGGNCFALHKTGFWEASGDVCRGNRRQFGSSPVRYQKISIRKSAGRT